MEFQGLSTKHSVILKAKVFTRRFFFGERRTSMARGSLGKATLDAH